PVRMVSKAFREGASAALARATESARAGHPFGIMKSSIPVLPECGNGKRKWFILKPDPHGNCMTIVLTIIHVIVCFFLVIVVLLQSGKAADLAGAFGGMGSQTAFGPRGSATVLSKATTIAAAVFMMTSLSLAILATRNAGSGSGSVLERQKQAPAKTAPAQPATPEKPKGPDSVNVQTPGGGATTVPVSQQSAPAKQQPAQQQPAPKK